MRTAVQTGLKSIAAQSDAMSPACRIWVLREDVASFHNSRDTWSPRRSKWVWAQAWECDRHHVSVLARVKGCGRWKPEIIKVSLFWRREMSLQSHASVFWAKKRFGSSNDGSCTPQNIRLRPRWSRSNSCYCVWPLLNPTMIEASLTKGEFIWSSKRKTEKLAGWNREIIWKGELLWKTPAIVG